MAMRLDADIRGLAEAAQTRRREAAERVKRGEIPHLNFMEQQDCFDCAEANLEQTLHKPGDAGIVALADTMVYGLAVIEKRDLPAPDQGGKS